ncbi:hypothetical protein ROZALSC1DRAFT_29387 [Rozella allomycis CSF55]|uniref:J domain-containing protein n=1 Tax=Rozella allomycis (strain CSF55) TaxID=988480 RepID=A0A075AZL8_ROZAC|nr:hypothetical protein O9G_003192 [Rozella allomycis CSF55]RKP18959.1 hypothetical protein ROZALSC1DRAFT_29387 [Rozella allomycis CSF55]|eukprot:EPZ34112.1 hypothetical protein O9G_003192 [Rozella allomycis CSF55]
MWISWKITLSATLILSMCLCEDTISFEERQELIKNMPKMDMESAFKFFGIDPNDKKGLMRLSKFYGLKYHPDKMRATYEGNNWDKDHAIATEYYKIANNKFDEMIKYQENPIKIAPTQQNGHQSTTPDGSQTPFPSSNNHPNSNKFQNTPPNYGETKNPGATQAPPHSYPPPNFQNNPPKYGQTKNPGATQTPPHSYPPPKFQNNPPKNPLADYVSPLEYYTKNFQPTSNPAGNQAEKAWDLKQNHFFQPQNAGVPFHPPKTNIPKTSRPKGLIQNIKQKVTAFRDRYFPISNKKASFKNQRNDKKFAQRQIRPRTRAK